MVAYTLVFLSLQILMLLDGVPLSLQSEEVIDFKQVELVEQLEHNMTKWCDNMELTFRAAPECGFPATRRLLVTGTGRSGTEFLVKTLKWVGRGYI